MRIEAVVLVAQPDRVFIVAAFDSAPDFGDQFAAPFLQTAGKSIDVFRGKRRHRRLLVHHRGKPRMQRNRRERNCRPAPELLKYAATSTTGRSSLVGRNLPNNSRTTNSRPAQEAMA